MHDGLRRGPEDLVAFGAEAFGIDVVLDRALADRLIEEGGLLGVQGEKFLRELNFRCASHRSQPLTDW